MIWLLKNRLDDVDGEDDDFGDDNCTSNNIYSNPRTGIVNNDTSKSRQTDLYNKMKFVMIAEIWRNTGSYDYHHLYVIV